MEQSSSTFLCVSSDRSPVSENQAAGPARVPVCCITSKRTHTHRKMVHKLAFSCSGTKATPSRATPTSQMTCLLAPVERELNAGFVCLKWCLFSHCKAELLELSAAGQESWFLHLAEYTDRYSFQYSVGLIVNVFVSL